MSLLTSVKSIPYNNAGYALLRAACMDPILAAVNAGVIQPGVPLSASHDTPPPSVAAPPTGNGATPAPLLTSTPSYPTTATVTSKHQHQRTPARLPMHARSPAHARTHTFEHTRPHVRCTRTRCTHTHAAYKHAHAHMHTKG